MRGAIRKACLICWSRASDDALWVFSLVSSWQIMHTFILNWGSIEWVSRRFCGEVLTNSSAESDCAQFSSRFLFKSYAERHRLWYEYSFQVLYRTASLVVWIPFSSKVSWEISKLINIFLPIKYGFDAKGFLISFSFGFFWQIRHRLVSGVISIP